MTLIRQQIDSLLRVEPTETGFIASLLIDETKLDFLADHFPGKPILPGFCMVQAVCLAAMRRLDRPDLTMTRVVSAKFSRITSPGQTLLITGTVSSLKESESVWHVKASFKLGEAKAGEVSVHLSGPQGAPV